MTEILPNTPLIIYEEGITMPLSWIDKNIIKKRTFIQYSDIKVWTIRKAKYLSTIESIIQIETLDGIAYSTGTYKDKEVIEKSYEILFEKIGSKMRSSP